jgi:hypothetical protein
LSIPGLACPRRRLSCPSRGLTCPRPTKLTSTSATGSAPPIPANDPKRTFLGRAGHRIRGQGVGGAGTRENPRAAPIWGRRRGPGGLAPAPEGGGCAPERDRRETGGGCRQPLAHRIARFSGNGARFIRLPGHSIKDRRYTVHHCPLADKRTVTTSVRVGEERVGVRQRHRRGTNTMPCHELRFLRSVPRILDIPPVVRNLLDVQACRTSSDSTSRARAGKQTRARRTGHRIANIHRPCRQLPTAPTALCPWPITRFRPANRSGSR